MFNVPYLANQAKGSLHKKKVKHFLHLGLTPSSPLFSGKCNKKPKKKENNAFKVQYLAILDHIFE